MEPHSDDVLWEPHDGRAPHAFVAYGRMGIVCAYAHCPSDELVVGWPMPTGADYRAHPIHQTGFFARLRFWLGSLGR